MKVVFSLKGFHSIIVLQQIFLMCLTFFMKMYIFDIKMKPSGLGCSRVVECVPSMLRAKGLASALHKEKKNAIFKMRN